MIKTEIPSGASLCGGKYVVEKTLGSGGFGITYLARHVTLGKKYAIKEFFLKGYNIRDNDTNNIVLQGIAAVDFEKLKHRFVEEAQTLAKLNHESVIKIIDIFDENGTSYMVMPFVEGITLQQMVDRYGVMEYDIAVNYIVQICDALSYIHSKSILHRDVTPDNVIVSSDQKVILIDFGSARKFDNDKTQRHTTIVKKGFAPLEQYSANSKKGAYTDLYSLGAVFYFLLTGERPIDATERTQETMKEPIELNPNIPKQINAVILKAMDMDTSCRYQTASEMAKDIMLGSYPKVKKSKKHKEPHPESKNKGVKTTAIVVFIVAVVTLLGVFLNRTYSKKNEPVLRVPSESTTAVNVEPKSISMDSILNINAGTVLLDLLSVDSRDPFSLYAIARKASNNITNPQMKVFWDSVLVPEGDVERHVKGDQEFTLKRFAFCCAARAYENCAASNYNQDDKERLSEELVKLLTELKNLDKTNLIL